MLRIIGAGIGFLAIGGLVACTSAQTASTDGTRVFGAPAAVQTDIAARGPFIGSWTGRLESGALVEIEVPESGNARYSFREERIPIASTQTAADGSMVLRFRGSTITLTPEGDQLIYDYRYRSDRASTALSRTA